MAKKKTCKRKRILNKDGSINKANIEHNKKCEKDMVKDNPWLNERGLNEKGLNEKGLEEYAELGLEKDHELMKEMKKEIKKTKARRKRIRRNKKKQKQSKKPTKAKKKPKKQTGGALCVPCISPVLTGLGIVGAGAGAVAGVSKAAKAGSSVIQKHSSRSSSSSSSDGRNIYRTENFELFEKVKRGKSVVDLKRKFTISQKNKKVTIQDGRKKTTDTFKTIQKASDFYNKKVMECKKDGFKKCTKRTKKLSKKKKPKKPKKSK